MATALTPNTTTQPIQQPGSELTSNTKTLIEQPKANSLLYSFAMIQNPGWIAYYRKNEEKHTAYFDRKEVSASSANAQQPLNKKLSALENAQKLAVRIQTLDDGRVRYYTAERASQKPGATRGSSFVTEHNPNTGQVRSWSECYDHDGNVNRIHPKTIDGQNIEAQHYPPTQSEIMRKKKS